MQYAIQIDVIRRVCFNALRKQEMQGVRAASKWMVRCHLSSLDLTLCRHMTKKWLGTPPLSYVPCSGQRGSAGGVRCCMHRRLEVARLGKSDDRLLHLLILGKTEPTIRPLHFLTNSPGSV